MNHAPSHEPVDVVDRRESSPRRVSPGRIALLVFLSIALFFLITEHRAHLYGALPYLFLLACPLMHLFHRHGHGVHHHHGSRDDGDDRPQGEQR